MKYDYDVLVIGLGPAGMAVAIMATEMGLKVAAIEKHKIGGECMNVGCIPSKSLLRIAKIRHAVKKFPVMELADCQAPDVKQPFAKIQGYLDFINETKTTKMFEKIDLFLGQGNARFINKHSVIIANDSNNNNNNKDESGDKGGRGGEDKGKIITAKRIFIAVGTKPAAPPIPGLDTVNYLTNENIFKLEKIPASMTIIGGGAIGCEMAQAFSRLGCKTTIVHMDPHLVPVGDPDAAALLEKQFIAEGIAVYNSRKIAKVANVESSGGGGEGVEGILLETDKGEIIISEKLLLGAGRRFDFSALNLENANIKHGRGGIEVDKYLRTSQKNVYAIGDCNGKFLLSHAAMHQGMIALMNTMLPGPTKMNYRKKYVVPWTVFTEPQISYVGQTEKQLNEKGIKYETIQMNYADYGAAIAEAVDIGFIKVFASKLGRVYGVSIIGEGSGEMINEWALIIQNKIRLYKIMMLQHSFPTMGFLSKRVGEQWMMNRMKESYWMKVFMRFLYRI